VTAEADVDAILADLAGTMPTAKAAAEAARLTGLPRKELYQRLLDMKGPHG
jgi:16S rRNA (cytidine1402-2'-O)-methyltransferase